MTPIAVAARPSEASLVSEEAGLFRFSENGKALHVLTPETPAPWKNYFFNDQYYLEIDQCGQGQARINDSVLRNLRAAYRHFYLKDEEDSEVWNLSCQPLNVSLDSYEAVHTLSHSRFHSKHHGITACVSVFVPTEGCREMWKVTLVNDTDRPRSLSLFSVFPFEDDPLMKARSWYNEQTGVCYGNYFPHHHAYDGYDRLKNRRTLNYLFSTSSPVSGESGERKFYGRNNFSGIPRAVNDGLCSGESSVMDVPIGALHHRFEISPGESVEVGICYGIEKDQDAVQDLQRRYATPRAFDEALDAVIERFDSTCGGLSIETPDKSLDGFVNYWLPKQIAFQSRKNRLSGAFPIRNQLQDCMGYSLIDPGAAADYLLTRVGLQREDGLLRQWWSEGDHDDHALCGLDFKDGGVWLILCSIIVANQNGALDLMDEEVPFHDSDQTAPVFEHLMRAARYLNDHRGEHDLCLFGDGDWTDPINGAGRGGKGESTWTTCALGVAVQRLREVAIARNDQEAADWLGELDESLQHAVHEHCWDGGWFVTGYDDDGIAFGTHNDEEGRIFLNSQTWAIIAGYVSANRLSQTMEAIRSLETRAGTLVSWPEFTQWNPTWGRISLKQAGTTENGSIYCHASMFKAFADCCLGNGADAMLEILRTLPTNPANPPSHNRQAPIFVPNYYYGLRDSSEFGVSSGHHHTGTAPWMLWLIVEHVFGIRATPDGLQVNPKLPGSWPEAKITRQYRGSSYSITVVNGDNGGEVGVEVDGVPFESHTLPCGNDKYQVRITV